MKQPSNEPKLTAGCSNIKRQRLSLKQGGNIAQKAFESDDKSIELPSEEPKNVASYGAVIENVTIGNEVSEIPEYIERITEPSESVSSLETIIDDCLHAILRYLSIMDIVNLARTSQRLHTFSKEEIFPNAAKVISIFGHYDMDYGFLEKLSLTSPLHSCSSVELTRIDLETAFRFFGEFVEDLTLCTVDGRYSHITNITVNILASCHNVQKLYINTYSCSSQQTLVFQKQIERLQHLNELEFVDCHGIIKYWRGLNHISNVTKLTLGTTFDHINGQFASCFRNLTSLSLDFTATNWQCSDFIEMFNNTSHSLKHLRVKSISQNGTPATLAPIMTDRLTNLEYLELELALTDETTCLINLPHLKSVKLCCKNDHSVNSALQTLSNNKIIEKVKIYGGVFEETVENTQPPLTFPKLRKLCWTTESFSGILQTFSRLQMPEIQKIHFSGLRIHDLDDLCLFIESKNALNVIKLHLSKDIVPVSFWIRVIGILKEFTTPRRAFLTFRIYKVKLEVEVVSKIPFLQYVS